MKNKAFTLAEILIALTVVGFLAIVMIRNVKSDAFMEKTEILKAYKAVNIFDEASVNLRDIDSEYCPLGKFIIKNVNTYESAVSIPSGKTAIDMYSDYIKFEKTGINFCSYSGNCNASSTNIPGAKLPSDIYIGIEVLDSIADCPDFYMPEENGQITVKNKMIEGAKPKCWAKLYIDTNGIDAPNTLGKDVFIFGMDEFGVHH